MKASESTATAILAEITSPQLHVEHIAEVLRVVRTSYLDVYEPHYNSLPSDPFPIKEYMQSLNEWLQRAIFTGEVTTGSKLKKQTHELDYLRVEERVRVNLREIILMRERMPPPKLFDARANNKVAYEQYARVLPDYKEFFHGLINLPRLAQETRYMLPRTETPNYYGRRYTESELELHRHKPDMVVADVIESRFNEDRTFRSSIKYFERKGSSRSRGERR
jgi:hypothetical protein